MSVAGPASQPRQSELVQLVDLLELRGAVGKRRMSTTVGTVREPRRFTTSRCVGLCTVVQGTGAKAALRDEDASLAVNLVAVGTRKPRAETRECTYHEVVNNTATLCHLGICQSAMMVKSLLVYGQASRDLSCALQLGVGVGVGWSRGDHQW